MWWILWWTLLVLGALAFLGLLGWRLVRRVIALGREVGRSAERAAPFMDRITEPYRPQPSVLVDPGAASATAPRHGRPRSAARRR